MASVSSRPRSDGTVAYRVKWREHGIQQSLTFNTRQAAELAAKRINSLGGRAPDDLWTATPTSPVTVADACRQHLDQLVGIQSDTREAYEKWVAGHLASIGDVWLADLDRDRIAKWVTHLHDDLELSPKTVKNIHGFLSAALATAVRGGMIGSNPAIGMRLPRVEPAEQVYLTPDEYQAIRDKLPLWAVPLADFLAGTGCRFGEATALTIRDIDPKAGTARISKAFKRGGEIGPPKTARSRRTVWLPRELVNVLHSLMQRDKDALLFVAPGGGRVTQQTFHRTWSVAAAKTGIHPLPRVHDLRHTHVAWLISQGVPLATIQDRLGHESITTTIDRYGHLESDLRVAAADAAGVAWQKPADRPQLEQ